jgi:hypothetical protein
MLTAVQSSPVPLPLHPDSYGQVAILGAVSFIAGAVNTIGHLHQSLGYTHHGQMQTVAVAKFGAKNPERAWKIYLTLTLCASCGAS